MACSSSPTDISPGTKAHRIRRRAGFDSVHNLIRHTHHRLTGKSELLDVACKTADYVYETFKGRDPKLADFPRNPSIIMGAVELYRTTGEKKYLDVANFFIDWRGSRGFAGERQVLQAAIRHLAARRTGGAARGEPTGLLTHHRDHDEACWRFIAKFTAAVDAHPAALWVAP